MALCIGQLNELKVGQYLTAKMSFEYAFQIQGSCVKIGQYLRNH